MEKALIIIIIGIIVAIGTVINILIMQNSLRSFSSSYKEGQDQFKDAVKGEMDKLKESTQAQLGNLQMSTMNQITQFKSSVNDQISQFQNSNTAQFMQLQQSSNDQMTSFRSNTSQIINDLKKTTDDKLTEMKQALTDGMDAVRLDTEKKLNEIKGTVDEKLQTTLEKRISESFKNVSTQLEQVYKGLGEMQSLASDVGGLKKVLSGVKTRGILGEIQLGAILEDILTPNQYDTNVATVPGRTERVEYAVRLPGSSDDSVVYLPIDSKFPGDSYEQLKIAQENADKKEIDAAYKQLENVIKKEAKDIHDKYIDPPHTTNFAIMFLPFEGLYSEVVNMGMVEQLQHKFQVNIAGPSTMAAMLNSLQMGFRTLAIQKRSNEVWEVLAGVKTEFETFESVLNKMKTHLSQTSTDLDNLLGTRTRAINRKLKNVQTLEISDQNDVTAMISSFDDEE